MTLVLTTSANSRFSFIIFTILLKECDVKGRGGGGQGVNVIVTFRSAKVVWKCPLSNNSSAV